MEGWITSKWHNIYAPDLVKLILTKQIHLHATAHLYMLLFRSVWQNELNHPFNKVPLEFILKMKYVVRDSPKHRITEIYHKFKKNFRLMYYVNEYSKTRGGKWANHSYHWLVTVNKISSNLIFISRKGTLVPCADQKTTICCFTHYW